MKGFVSGLLAQAIANLPAGRRLRVLEIAACAIRLGSATLAQVDFDRCDYAVCAGSQELLDTYEGLFERYPGIERKVIDLDASLTEIAEAELGRYDLVLACDTLSRPEHWGHLLHNLGEALLPGGLVLFVEPARARWSNLVSSGALVGMESAGGQAPRLSEQLEGIREACLASGFEEPEILYNGGSVDQGPQVLTTRTLHTALAGASTADNESQLFVVLQGYSGYASALATSLIEALESAGHVVVTATPGKTFAAQGNTFSLDMNSCEQLQGLLSALLEGHGTVDGMVYLFGLDPELEAAPSVGYADNQLGRVPSFMHLLQACAEAELVPDIWVVTSGAAGPLGPALATTDVGRLADAPLWGFARTAINEFPDMAIRLIDLAAPQQLERMSSGIVDELLHPTAEDEIVLTADGRFVARLQALEDEDPWARVRPKGPAAEVQLDFRFPGPLKHLLWRSAPSRAVGPTDVAIEVRAAGLNFRDVMYAMGLLSEEAVENGFAGATLGMELSGVVTHVGERVTHVVPGDEVFAFAPASFATRAVTQATAVVHKPAAWSFAAAATVPTTFFTAYYALQYLARLTPGERVLIHGAAGGVGIAAVQLAKHLGAEVFATAGSDEKRDFVRLLGADHVMNSRSLAFADEILDITNGDGVDVVLNSLAGEAISRNLKVLRPFGRFLELGKRDYYENTRIGLRPFRNNIAYFGIDADQLMAERPGVTERLFKELMELFEAGHLKPLPFREFPAAEAVDAFRYMQQSKQIGKVVLSFEQRPRAAWVEKPEGAALQLPEAATYLVTGGLSGFGATTAEWLAAKGARHLVLLSRQGAASEEGRALVERLTRAGVETRAYACDVTDDAALGTVFAEIQAQMPPLRGVVHAAMVIADDLIRNMDEAQLTAVFAPKIKGALNLHQFTKTLALDFFVLYSSATTFFGNPGQANYVAANYFLEALAAHRRACGLPATSAGWGPIDDVGYLARHQEIKQALQSKMGGAALTSVTALKVLEQLLLSDATGIGVLDVDWASLRRFLPSAEAPRYARLAQMAEESDVGLEGHEEIERLLDELSTDELTAVFVEMLKKEVGDILRIAPERIDEHRSVYELGMDSLMGMELIAAVEARFGVHLPIMALSEGPTMARLAERIIKRLKTPHGEEEEAQTVGDEVKQLAAQHGVDVDQREIDEFTSELERDKHVSSGARRH
jgi:NADPH:quinone reductase-like Zn-dependent oxidoreductase/acyl carrier protein